MSAPAVLRMDIFRDPQLIITILETHVSLLSYLDTQFINRSYGVSLCCQSINKLSCKVGHPETVLKSVVSCSYTGKICVNIMKLNEVISSLLNMPISRYYYPNIDIYTRSH